MRWKRKMTLQRKYFGTDGIRGEVGKFPVTPDFVLKLGWAVGNVLNKQGGKFNKVLIGKDTRISGYMFESALEAGLSAAGVDIHLLGPMPTPAVAYLTRTLRAQAGIVISASHNSYQDNGIKFFSSDGTKLPDEAEMEIEACLDSPMTSVFSEKLGKAERVVDATGRYIEFCKSTVSSKLTLRGMKIIVDCANGATYQAAPEVFRELGAEVIELAVDPDGLNINDFCGATHPDMLRRIVTAEEADLGIAFDGDGDRVMMVDGKGEIVDGDELLFVIARYLQDKKQLKGGVVGTVMSNLGFELALRNLGIEFVRSKVGDRYVMEQLLEKGWLLGGENSGHIIYLDATTTGDGIISALQVLSAMSDSGKSLHELKGGIEKFPQVLINVKVVEKIDVSKNAVIQKAKLAAENSLKNKGRVLLRASGTEPVIRVMVEGEDAKMVTEIAKNLAAVVKAASV
jgi:phosphoglucosamine mutase